MEITSNQQFEQFVIEYGFRYHSCQQFTVNDLLMYLPLANRTKIDYMLQDLAIKGTIKRIGQSFYQVPDHRNLNQKIGDMFGNRYVFYTVAQICNVLKEREDQVKVAVEELVKDGLITPCPFIGGAYWLNTQAE